MAEADPGVYVAEVEDENLRYVTAHMNEALSNFPLILTPYDDVDYINEVEQLLKKDGEDFKRILHAHLLSNGAAGGWLPEILKSAMNEVDAYVQEHFKYNTFKEFIDQAIDVVRVEDGQFYHPVLDDLTHRELYEDAVASVKNKDEKGRKKEEQLKRNLENPDSVRGFYEGVNQLRKAVQQAFDVHGNKETPLRYIPSMDGTNTEVPGINYNYVCTEFKNIFNIPLNKDVCKKICGRSTLMKGIDQAKPKCLIESITMWEYKTGGEKGELPGMYIALKNGSTEYSPAVIEAAVKECRSQQSEVENRQTNRHNRDQITYARRQQHQDRPSGESQIQRDARLRREEMEKNDAAVTAAAALSIPTRSVPPSSSTPAPIVPSMNQRPLDPNRSDSSGRLDSLARGGAPPSASVPANVMSTRSDGRNDYGDLNTSADNLGYSDEDEDDDAVERMEEEKRKKAERERLQREEREREADVTPPEPVASTIQQHPSSVSRTTTPSYAEYEDNGMNADEDDDEFDLALEEDAAMNGRSTTPAATHSNPHRHGNFQNTTNPWEKYDDEDSPTVVERKSPVQQPPAAAPTQQHQLQQQPSYPPSSLPPPTPTPSTVYGEGMQQVPPPLQQQQPYVYSSQQMLQMQPLQQYPPPGPPYMGQSIAPSPAPSQSNVVPGQPQMYHPVPQYAGYPPGSIPPTPPPMQPMQPMQQPGAPYGGVPPPHPSYPHHPQQYPPPPQGAPYGRYPQQPPMQPQQQQPYYQGAPNQQQMQQPQYPQGTQGYPSPGGGNNSVAPVVNVHVMASPSPSPPAGADHHNYNPAHQPAPAQNYPPDQKWPAPPPQQGYREGGPPPPPAHRQSPPSRRDPPPPPFQQYYPNRDSPQFQSHYHQSNTRDDRHSAPREAYGGHPMGRRKEPDELLMYDEDRAARLTTRWRGGGQTPMEYGGSQSMEGQRQGYDSGFGRGGGACYAGVGGDDGRRVDRRFEVQQQAPPRGFGQQSVHRQNERPLRAHDDREGFSPLGASTPLTRSPERERLWNNVEGIDDPKRNIRWQVDELFELVQLGCGNEMELFLAIETSSGEQFLDFLKDMDRDGLICLYRDRIRRNTNSQMFDDIYKYMYGDNGQDSSRPTSRQYPQPGQYQGGQYQNQPPAQYQGGGPNQQYQQGPAPPGDYQPQPTTYQDPRLGQQAAPAGYYPPTSGQQFPTSGYPPFGQQAPPPGTPYHGAHSANQTPPPGYHAPPTDEQQTTHGAYQGVITGYPAPSNNQQVPPTGLLSVATTDYPPAPGGYQAPQTGGYQDPSAGYRGPPNGQQIPSTGYYAPSNDYQPPLNMNGCGSTGYPPPSQGQQTPSDYHDPHSGYQSNPSGGYPQQCGHGQSGSADHSGQYMQPMQQEQPQSDYAPLPRYDEDRRRSPPQQPSIDPRVQYGHPEYQGEYRTGPTQHQTPRAEERQYDTRPNRSGVGMAQQPPQHHHPQQYDEERRGGERFGGFGARRTEPRIRNFGGFQYEVSEEDDEQLYRLSLLDRTDDDVQQRGMRRGGEGPDRRQYEGQHESAPSSFHQQQAGHGGQTRPRSGSPDYWAMANKYERGTEEWMKLSIINILKAYSTVSPEEKDVKMVTVEHLSKILRSYDLGKMVPKGNRPDDLIGGTLGYRPDITWLNLLRQMRDEGLLRLHEMHVTAIKDFAIFAPYDRHSPKFANPEPFIN
ncbi:hypothetical protein PRIPAC_73815 [Pristionchus pacificus]|uniref:Uncharacterized protein n=1 Tax=Pristionchus pacificus TaxID=54126 RepID=A0A2A6D0L0_PRIPA|nr:hypothetical protein PRIPAC_73815 [Pristionchus pacificus]|eukprot:PDM83910.1 hypothetical protein PRIPAC_30397 [Pristionchus pacificus]